MPRQHHRLVADRLGQGCHVVPEIAPGQAALGLGGKAAEAMAAQVHRQDAQAQRQRAEDGAVGVGVEAVGVDEHHVHGARGVAEVKRRHLAVGQADHPLARFMEQHGVHGSARYYA